MSESSKDPMDNPISGVIDKYMPEFTITNWVLAMLILLVISVIASFTLGTFGVIISGIAMFVYNVWYWAKYFNCLYYCYQRPIKNYWSE